MIRNRFIYFNQYIYVILDNMSESSNYIPGMCNINPAEIRRRRLTGYVMLGSAVIVFATFLYLHTAWPYYILLFVLLFTGRLSLLQANHKFCAAYATARKHHADESDVVNVADQAAHKADIKKAQRLYIQAFAAALPITLICFFISRI